MILDDGVYKDEHPGQILAGALAINNAALLAGDNNHDDRVDAADYVVWRKTFGSTTQLAADGSEDKMINEADYEVWRNNFGLTVLSDGLSSALVPEPCGWVLCATGLCSYVWFAARGIRRCRNQR